ncbi:zinc carboxypeptidase domain-containing protein [Ditylenchus destructor]|nr:zinc carboxypeptidase domain-containing protein [Ditylenchus destructor]
MSHSQSYLCSNPESVKSDHLDSLFPLLIDLSINQAPSENLKSVAQLIEPLFSTAESDPSTYKFLSPHTTTPVTKKKIVKKMAKSSPRNEKSPRSKAKIAATHKKAFVKPPLKSHSSDPHLIVMPSTSAACSALNFFANKKRSRSFERSNLIDSEDMIQRLLKSIELSSDDLTVVVLCKLLQGFVVCCKINVSQKRLRSLSRLDATNYLLRAMRSYITNDNPSPMQIAAVDALAATLMAVSVKDRKFMLKIRISGILPGLRNRILEADRLFCTVILLRFICRCLRSPRNAQVIGKERNFAERFVTALNSINVTAMESTPNVDYEICKLDRDITSTALSSEDFLPVQSMIKPLMNQCEEYDAEIPTAYDEKMARLLEVLFFISKNKRSKTQLLEQHVVGLLKTILGHHFELRQQGAVHLEISLVTIASVRQLSRTKKGREQLMTLSMLEMCENYIGQLAEDRARLSIRPKVISSCTQLQDSLCALCLRCLPQLPFPLPKDQPFPLKFNLPSKGSLPANDHGLHSRQLKTSTPHRKSTRRSTSPQKRARSIPLGDDQSYASSDDGLDEEDGSFMFPDRTMEDSGHMNTYSDVELDDDTEDLIQPGSSTVDEITPAFQVSNYSCQNMEELRANYRHFFTEFEQECTPRISKSYLPSIIHSASLPKNCDLLQMMANRTVSVGRFVKVAFPEIATSINADDPSWPTRDNHQVLLESSESMREMIVQEMARSRLKPILERRVVYDLDKLILADGGITSRSSHASLGNCDLDKVGTLDSNVDHLKFESRFESGNLRRVIQVSESHYELILSPDINESSPHFQWFYFEVSNIAKADVPYTFEIINCLKNQSMFSKGMQPVFFSVTEAKQGRSGWVRASSSVCYYRNLYTATCDNNGETVAKEVIRPTRSRTTSTPIKTKTTKDPSSGQDTKSFFSARFTITFPHVADICYVAYHYPYTYSYLNTSIECLLYKASKAQKSPSNNIHIRVESLTQSLGGNPVPLLTITASGSLQELEKREIVLLTGRVHPGESNASWIMHGIIQFLASNRTEAKKARENFVFKLIPMLNPDGVVNGSHRCSLAGIDLNRIWDRPSAVLHPTTFHVKGLVQYMVDVLRKTPFVFVDLHGHSRRPNVFLYGNNPEESWRQTDHKMEHNFKFLGLPEMLEKIAPGFTVRDCRFSVTKSKEFSARIGLWRQFGIERAYTMEATYCGFDSGPSSGKQITTSDLVDIGAKLCEAILLLKQSEENGNKVNKDLIQKRNTESKITPRKSARNKGPFDPISPISGLSASRIIPVPRKSLSIDKIHKNA